MLKIIGIKENLDIKNENILEFKSCIKDLLEKEEVKSLKNYKHHLNTDRLQHSINVSYYSYVICKKLKCDYRSAARGALLHDLFHYDWENKKEIKGWHAVEHPKTALKNAKKIVNLNKIEIDSIVKHMWPISLIPPIYKESIIISFLDKYCAILEVCGEIIFKIINKIKNIKNLFRKTKLQK